MHTFGWSMKRDTAYIHIPLLGGATVIGLVENVTALARKVKKTEVAWEDILFWWYGDDANGDRFDVNEIEEFDLKPSQVDWFLRDLTRFCEEWDDKKHESAYSAEQE